MNKWRKKKKRMNSQTNRKRITKSTYLQRKKNFVSIGRKKYKMLYREKWREREREGKKNIFKTHKLRLSGFFPTRFGRMPSHSQSPFESGTFAFALITPLGPVCGGISV
jgi:hypothetical protein